MKTPPLSAAATITIALLASQLPAAHAQTTTATPPAHIVTRWAKDVSPTNARSEYPRPQMVRSRWQNLNGTWQFAAAQPGDTPPIGRTLGGSILVPYPVESTLSGVGRRVSSVWYRRLFTVPDDWQRRDQRVLLHFDAVNYKSAFYLNGQKIGEHTGGYDAFTFDITANLKPGDNELVVRADNPAVDTDQVLGKQRNRPGGIFYTAATGIWQTAWLEPVPAGHIDSLHITPDVDGGSVQVATETSTTAAPTSGGLMPVRVTVLEGKKKIGESADGKVSIAHPHLWTPDDPYLYNLRVELLGPNGKAVDSVDSYFAMRKISLGKDDQGRTTIQLNNKSLLQIGLLDQGYWPDGIYTAPTDEALRYDIEIAKKMGFNLLRKHAKVEPERWYYWTDKLGMLVWQDMPQAFWKTPTDEQKAEFRKELGELIPGKYNNPSIVVWTTFNEGWGEHDVPATVDFVKSLDATRLVNNASGWNDEKVGDIHDTHAYPGPWSNLPEPTRAAVNGEYGGVTMRVPGHMWTTDVFGYGSTLHEGRAVTRRYQQLQQTAYRLVRERGTCAFVYTQLTDVEQESNGLLTYDRAIIKPDVAIVVAANKGQFPPLPPDPNPPILPTSEDEAQVWKYTTDKPADGWQQPDFADAGWKSGPGGFGHGVGPIHTPWTTDDIWLRRSVTIPAKLPAKLSFLAFHDEDIEIYINGVLAGSATGYNTSYAEIPLNDAGRAALKPGASNVIAVHCHQTVGGQFVDVGIIAAGTGG